MTHRACRESNKQSSSTFSLPQRTKGHIRLRSGSCVLLIILVIAYSTKTAYGKPSYKDFHDDFESEESIEDREQMEGIISIIVGVVVFCIVAIFAFILCLCCPICILAKMRSRRRGVVYRSAATTANGTTVTTAQNRNGTTITITAPPRTQNVTPVQTAPMTATNVTPQMIAISNNANQPNKPYPVQQSVTVVPVISQQSQPQYGPVPTSMPGPAYGYHQNAPYPASMPTPQSDAGKEPQYPSELPPPYPGLPREMDSANLPYNPYFTESGPQASAPFKQ